MLAQYQEYATPTLLLLICIDVVQIALKFISVLTSLFDVIVIMQYICTSLKNKCISVHFCNKMHISALLQLNCLPCGYSPSLGAVTATCTSPIWVVKTQLQLDNRPGRRPTMRGSIQKLYRLDGMKGFYRGLTASYAGAL